MPNLNPRQSAFIRGLVLYSFRVHSCPFAVGIPSSRPFAVEIRVDSRLKTPRRFDIVALPSLVSDQGYVVGGGSIC